MRLRSWIAALAGSVMVLTALPSTPAHAGAVVTVNGFDFPTPISESPTWDCGGTHSWGSTVPDSYRWSGSSTGDHSIGWKVPSVGEEVGPQVSVDDLIHTTFQVDVYVRSTADFGHVFVEYYSPGGSIYTGVRKYTTDATGWRLVSFGPAAPLTWYVRDPGGENQALGSDQTMAAFAADHAFGSSISGFVNLGWGCSGNEFEIDNMLVGTPSGATTYDFEGVSTESTLTAGGSTDITVPAGTSVSLTGGATSLGDGTVAAGSFAGQATLYAAAPSDSSATPVSTTTFSSPTSAHFTVAPSSTTSYLLRSMSTNTFEQSDSTWVTVHVLPAGGGSTPGPSPTGGAAATPTAPHTQPGVTVPVPTKLRMYISARAKSRSVPVGSKVRVTGSVLNGRPGLQVWLQARGRSRFTYLPGTDGRTHGARFSVSAKATKVGPWVVRVVAYDSVNHVLSFSGLMRLTVRPKPAPPPAPAAVVTQQKQTQSHYYQQPTADTPGSGGQLHDQS